MLLLEPGYTGPKKIRPSELKYCHGTISSTFGDGTSLLKTFEDIVYERLSPEELPPLETMYYPFGGILCVTNGNRRLFVLQKLESYGVISDISVNVREFDAELFKRQNLSLCNGSYVRVRDDNDIDEKLKDIWEDRSKHIVKDARQVYEFPIKAPEKKSSFPYFTVFAACLSSVFIYFLLGTPCCLTQQHV